MIDNRFKPGDRVRVRNNGSFHYIEDGSIGTVVKNSLYASTAYRIRGTHQHSKKETTQYVLPHDVFTYVDEPDAEAFFDD